MRGDKRALTIRKAYTVAHPAFNTALMQLLGLRRLFINGCRLSEFPSALATLTSLERLDLRDNVLTTLSQEVGALTALQNLHLSSNRLDSLPESIANLVMLERRTWTTRCSSHRFLFSHFVILACGRYLLCVVVCRQ